MAEVFVSIFLPLLCEKLTDRLLEELGSLFSVRKDLQKLRSRLSAIEAVLQDAEERQGKEHTLKDWLRKLKDVAYDADDIVDGFATEALRRRAESRDRTVNKVQNVLSSLKLLWFRVKMGCKIRDVMERLDEIAEERSKFQLRESGVSSRIGSEDGKETHSFVDAAQVYGRRDEKEKLVHMLIEMDTEADISIIAIVGIGGLGKTAFAQFIYNDEKVAGYFNLKMWVCVSVDFDVKKLAREIIASATKENCNLSNMDLIQARLREILRGKKFLLILDDVWNENEQEWEDLKTLLRAGAPGSKVMVTTRNKKVAAIMGTLPTHDLEMLPFNHCWSLFKQRAFQPGNGEDFRNFAEIGREIVKKCGGVPLVALSLGGLLRFKRSQSDWLAIRDSEIWQFDEDRRILSALRLSYVHLPTHLKQCFVYCSVFPKDYLFEKNELVQHWMAEGLLPSGESRLMEDFGADYFDELSWRSFFQDVEEHPFFRHTTYCKMHDLFNDLARSIAGAESSTLDIGMEEHIQENARYSLLVSDEKSESIKSEFFYKAKKLRTFIILDKGAISSYFRLSIYETREAFVNIEGFRCLRVLVLCSTGIRKLPESIGKLKHLRYLDLSNTRITSLPSSICSLWNLQTLGLYYCGNLCEWPKDMRKMISLRHLKVNVDTESMQSPFKIGQLRQLQSLPVFFVGRENGYGMEELQDLNLLRGELWIRNLENVVDPTKAQKAELKKKKDLRFLALEWGEDNTACAGANVAGVIECLQPHSNLKELMIENYSGARIPEWMTDSQLPNLVEVTLRGCRRCESLPLLSELKVLIIEGMPNLKKWLDISEGKMEPPCVEKLVISHCPELSSLPCLPRLTELILEDSNEMLLSFVADCKSLSSLEISGLPEMVSLPERFLQKHNLLRSLIIDRCHKLKSLEKRLNCLTSLESLRLSHLPKLESLLGGIENLTSLQELKIWECPRIGCLPMGLQHLNLLKYLEISACPEISRRCQRDRGEDWHKVQHISRIVISGIRI